MGCWVQQKSEEGSLVTAGDLENQGATLVKRESHPLPAHKQVLTGRSFQLRKDLIILGIYLRRFQNPRGDSDADRGKTCVPVSIHHRPSGAGG